MCHSIKHSLYQHYVVPCPGSSYSRGDEEVVRDCTMGMLKGEIRPPDGERPEKTAEIDI